jgi:hypothetical protein
MNGSSHQIVFVKLETFVVVMIFVKTKMFVLKLLMAIKQLLLIVAVFIYWDIEFGD